MIYKRIELDRETEVPIHLFILNSICLGSGVMDKRIPDRHRSHIARLRQSRVLPNLKKAGRTSTLLLLLLCLFHPISGAQVSATLSGIVSDQSGAAVSAADITARNLDTNLSRETITDQAGRYQIVALPLGQYEVRVKRAGFAEAIRTGIRLVVGQDARVDLTLKVGAVSEEVKVSGDAPV